MTDFEPPANKWEPNEQAKEEHLQPPNHAGLPTIEAYGQHHILPALLGTYWGSGRHEKVPLNDLPRVVPDEFYRGG